MKKLIALLLITTLALACSPGAMEGFLNGLNDGQIGQSQIVKGLKEALRKGVEKGVKKLAAKNGFYTSAYKILLPEEAQQVTTKLRFIPGFTNVENIVIEKINHAAEDAVKRARPIFVDAIVNMSITDAMGILKGQNDAATNYLVRTTSDQLYKAFQPIIVQSLNKFGALDYWSDAVNTYNKIPFVKHVNPKLDDYITHKAMDALFDQVKKEEANIRTNIRARTSDLLRKVFALQDKK